MTSSINPSNPLLQLKKLQTGIRWIYMLRTQIYLKEEIYERLNVLKKIKGISVAKIIRNILEDNLKTEEEVGNDLSDLVILKLKGGPKDLSKKMNYYSTLS